MVQGRRHAEQEPQRGGQLVARDETFLEQADTKLVIFQVLVAGERTKAQLRQPTAIEQHVHQSHEIPRKGHPLQSRIIVPKECSFPRDVLTAECGFSGGRSRGANTLGPPCPRPDLSPGPRTRISSSSAKVRAPKPRKNLPSRRNYSGINDRGRTAK